MTRSMKQMVLTRDALGDGEGEIGMSAGRRTWMMFLAALLAVVAAMVVSATQPQEANATTTVSVKTCNGGTIQLNADEKRALDLHNQTRAANGLPGLCVHPALTNAARSHSQEMLDKGYFAHNSYNGETVKARLERFGYTFSGYSFWKYGENIYWGSGTSSSPESAHKWWMNSAGHKANILNKDFREVGIGVRTGTYKGYAGAKMYTVDFGVRR
jgi:uncharacterized protein YkwD